MAHGLPSEPPNPKDHYQESADEYCPECGWDTSTEMLDPQAAYNNGSLQAVEEADSSPYSAMGGAQLLCHYWRCPNMVTKDVEVPHPSGYEEHGRIFEPKEIRCGAHFTTETENFLGSMA